MHSRLVVFHPSRFNPECMFHCNIVMIIMPMCCHHLSVIQVLVWLYPLHNKCCVCRHSLMMVLLFTVYALCGPVWLVSLPVSPGFFYPGM